MIKECLFVLFFVAFVQALKVIPTRSKIEYANPEVVINATTSVRRSGRRTGYHFNLAFQLLKTVDNEFQVSMQAFEVISGKNVPLPFWVKHNFCNFFTNDALLGKLIVKQLPKYASECPYVPRYYSLQNLTYDTEFPFDMPFTFQRQEHIALLDFQVFKDKAKQFHLTVHLQVIQKQRNGKVNKRE